MPLATDQNDQLIWGGDQPLQSDGSRLAAAKREAEALLGREIPMLDLPAPHPALRSCVVVPARNEERIVSRLLLSLAGQRTCGGRRLNADEFEVILLLNNCDDRTQEVAEAWARRCPELRLHVATIRLLPEEAHVGRARQIAFDTAFMRFLTIRNVSGVILTTDADTQVAENWIKSNHAEIDAGVDGVGGRILIERRDLSMMSEGVRRLFLLDIGYRRVLEELRDLFAPDEHDPLPRHHQHFGGSMAITAAAYGRAKGMPLVRSSEDVALYHAVLKSGGKFRHSLKVQAHTSARMAGRADGGLADAILWWHGKAESGSEVCVESAYHAACRLREYGRARQAGSGNGSLGLLQVPDPAPVEARQELHAMIKESRDRISVLRRMSLKERWMNEVPR